MVFSFKPDKTRLVIQKFTVQNRTVTESRDMSIIGLTVEIIFFTTVRENLAEDLMKENPT
jgi:hypothetical protein